MHEIEQLKAVTTVVVHDNCTDGLASAMILLDALPNATFRFVQYNSPEHLSLQAQPNMLFCDITPHASKVQDFKAVQNVWVLDHHKTAKSIVEQFGAKGIFADFDAEPGVSGAVLAWREVWLPIATHSADLAQLSESQRQAHKNAEIAYTERLNQVYAEKIAQGKSKAEAQAAADTDPSLAAHKLAMSVSLGSWADKVTKFAQLAGIRDTWQKNSPLWTDAVKQHLVLSFFPRDQWMTKGNVFHHNDPAVWESRMGLGDVLLMREQEKVAKAIAESYTFQHDGWSVTLFEGTAEASDAADLLTSDVVIGWRYLVESKSDVTSWPSNPNAKGPKLVCSCRSRGTFDVSELAKSLGGGGHKGAAGFNVNVKSTDTNPYLHIKALVSTYIDSMPPT